MALTDFFRINLPYGIAKNENGEWMAFNREYRPIGFNEYSKKEQPGDGYQDMAVYTQYENLSEDILKDLAHSEVGIHKNKNGEIEKVFFYTDETNPMNQTTDKEHLWAEYFEKIRKLSKLEIKNRPY